MNTYTLILIILAAALLAGALAYAYARRRDARDERAARANAADVAALMAQLAEYGVGVTDTGQRIAQAIASGETKNMNYLQIFDYVKGHAEPSTLGPGFIGRVGVAIAHAAVDVLAELPNNGARRAWAVRALANIDGEAARMVWGVLANPTIALDPDGADDGAVQFTVNSLVNTYAAQG
jgi:hypothetical protein